MIATRPAGEAGGDGLSATWQPGGAAGRRPLAGLLGGSRLVQLGVAALAITVSPAFASPQAAPDSADASLHGTVTGVFRERSGVLPHALLAVETPGGRRWVQAGEDGSYSLDGLRPGVVTVRVRHPGYEAIAVEVTLAAGASVRVDLELTGRPLRLDPVEIRADRLTGESTAGDETGRPRLIPELEIQALDLTPGVGDPALAAAVRALPGNDPASATDVLYLRGSTADMKLVLLDGAPVYTPFHVAGLMPGFEPALLGAAALHRGGAPARYDGGLTHILDLRTRSPRRDRVRASAALDLLTASGAVEGPLGTRGGFLASGRGLHDVGSGPLGGDRPYGYSDLLLAAEYEPGDDHRVGVTVFRNTEAVLLDYEAAPDDATWSNRAFSLSYEGAVGSARVRALAAASDYDASLPLQPSSTDSIPAAAPLLAAGANRRVRLLAEVEWGGATGRTVVGVSHNHIEAEYGARAPAAGTSTTTNATHTTPGLHVDAVRLLAPEVTLRAGVRADLFPDGDLALAPRARLAWAFDPRALLSVAVGRYHQPTRTPDVEVERTLQEVVSSDLSAPQLLPVARPTMSSSRSTSCWPVACASGCTVTGRGTRAWRQHPAEASPSAVPRGSPPEQRRRAGGDLVRVRPLVVLVLTAIYPATAGTSPAATCSPRGCRASSGDRCAGSSAWHTARVCPIPRFRSAPLAWTRRRPRPPHRWSLLQPRPGLPSPPTHLF